MAAVKQSVAAKFQALSSEFLRRDTGQILLARNLNFAPNSGMEFESRIRDVV